MSNSVTSTLTRLNPESGELIGQPLKLPEGSMGRIACDIDDTGEYIYIPGIEHIFKIRVEKEQLSIEKSWSVK